MTMQPGHAAKDYSRIRKIELIAIEKTLTDAKRLATDAAMIERLDAAISLVCAAILRPWQDRDIILNAVDAYNGGAADTEDESEGA